MLLGNKAEKHNGRESIAQTNRQTFVHNKRNKNATTMAKWQQEEQRRQQQNTELAAYKLSKSE